MPGGRHRATAYPLTKISLWVGADDWQWLQRAHKHDCSRVIRDLIIRYRHEIEDPHTGELETLDLEGL